MLRDEGTPELGFQGEWEHESTADSDSLFLEVYNRREHRRVGGRRRSRVAVARRGGPRERVPVGFWKSTDRALWRLHRGERQVLPKAAPSDVSSRRAADDGSSNGSRAAKARDSSISRISISLRRNSKQPALRSRPTAHPRNVQQQPSQPGSPQTSKPDAVGTADQGS